MTAQEVESLDALETQLQQTQLARYKEALMSILRLKDDKEFHTFCTEHKYDASSVESLKQAKDTVVASMRKEIYAREAKLVAPTGACIVYNRYLSDNLTLLTKASARELDRAVVFMLNTAHKMAPDQHAPLDRTHFFARVAREAYNAQLPAHPVGCYHSVPDCTEREALSRAIRNHMEECCKMQLRKAPPPTAVPRKRKRRADREEEEKEEDKEEGDEKKQRIVTRKTRGLYVGIFRNALTERNRLESAVAIVRYGRVGPVHAADFAVVSAKRANDVIHPLAFQTPYPADATPRSTDCLAWNRLEQYLEMRFPSRQLDELVQLRKVLRMSLPSSLEGRLMHFVTQYPERYMATQPPPLYDPFAVIMATPAQPPRADVDDEDEEMSPAQLRAYHGAKRPRLNPVV